MAGDLKMEITIDGKKQKTKYQKRDQFGAELAYFSQCIIGGVNPEPNGIEGLADVRIINALEESAAKGKPVEILPRQTKPRPSIGQEIHKPPVEPAPLVRAQSPSE